MPRVPVSFRLTVHAGEPVCLSVRDGDGREAFAQSPPPEAARNKPVTEERCVEQLRKTGGTPFLAQEVSCDLEDGLSVPVSLLNRLRREALEKLEWLRAVHEPVAFSMKPFSPTPHRVYLPDGKLPLRARFANANLPEAAKQCERVYLPYTTVPEKLAALQEEGFRVALDLPRGLFGMEQALKQRLAEARDGRHARLGGNLGAAALAKAGDDGTAAFLKCDKFRGNRVVCRLAWRIRSWPGWRCPRLQRWAGAAPRVGALWAAPLMLTRTVPRPILRRAACIARQPRS
ncbi:MAG: DUF3656 domain-containing protein [Anaeromassilibacillus sp.]